MRREGAKHVERDSELQVGNRRDAPAKVEKVKMDIIENGTNSKRHRAEEGVDGALACGGEEGEVARMSLGKGWRALLPFHPTRVLNRLRKAEREARWKEKRRSLGKEENREVGETRGVHRLGCDEARARGHV